MKILNLYSGIGGNRKLWPDNIVVTAVEQNEDIAKIYQDFYPNDLMIIGDAHQYLLDHYKEYDFIWSSPPCPTHSNLNYTLNAQGIIRYPDMTLYQEIILLMKFSKKKYCVENVKSYYGPLIVPQHRERHYFWSNFYIPKTKFDPHCVSITNSLTKTWRNVDDHFKEISQYHGIFLEKCGLSLTKKIKLLANCTNPKLGLLVFNAGMRKEQMSLPQVTE